MTEPPICAYSGVDNLEISKRSAHPTLRPATVR